MKFLFIVTRSLLKALRSLLEAVSSLLESMSSRYVVASRLCDMTSCFKLIVGNYKLGDGCDKFSGG